MSSTTEPPSEDRPLDELTRDALVKVIEDAKLRGWTKDDLKIWFAGLGVTPADYLLAKAGGAVPDHVFSQFAMVSIRELPDHPPRAIDDYDDIPAQMKAARRWLLWRSEPGEKKPRKVPYYTSGSARYGALDTPEDTARLDTFAAALKALQTGSYTGLGFALGQDETGQHWQGIDLDALTDHPGLNFIAADLPGYTEKSPSGKGVHAIGYGRRFISLGSNATGIEAYADKRYFTVTGAEAGLGDLVCLADFVEGRLAPLHTPRPQDTSQASQERAGTLAGQLAVPHLRSALASMPSDDRDLWIKMGLALKELGDIGRGLWIEWSQTSEKYDATDAGRTWASFKPDHTGYAAVFAEAQRRGWTNPAAGSASAGQAQPEEPKTDSETGEPIVSRPFRASEFNGEPPARQWVVPEWIVQGAVNSLYGDGGVGKTLLAQQLACAVSMGANWLGLPTTQGTVLAVLCEDEKDELWRRHNDIKAAMGHSIGNPFSEVWLWPRVGDANVLVRWDRDGLAQLGSFYAEVVAMVEEHQPTLLILDTLADVYGGNEIDRPQVNYFVKTVLGGLIKARAAAGSPLTVLLLGHPSVAGKASGSGYSGSTAWNNAVRSRMYLTRPEEGASDERVLTRGKANYASSGDETAVRLFFAEGVLHASEDTEDGDSILWACKRDVVSLVDKAWNSGEPYSGQKTHRRYIYTALVSDMLRGGFDPRVIRQALRELIIDDGKISLSKGRDKRGYRSGSHD